MKSFDTLKILVTKAPVLSFPIFKLHFDVSTDASNVGLAALLYQLPNGEGDASKVNYICFLTRAIQSHERNFTPTKKELLGICFALQNSITISVEDDSHP